MAGNFTQGILGEELLNEGKENMVFFVDMIHKPLDNGLGRRFQVHGSSVVILVIPELDYCSPQLDE